MVKKKDSSELEHLRGINRQLKKQLKKVSRQASRVEKDATKKINELMEDSFEEPIEVEELDVRSKCPKCKANISPIDMGARLVINCTKCGHRESRKK